MIPFKDDNPRTGFPYVTVLLISANIAVFAHQFMLPESEYMRFVLLYGAVPSHIILGDGLTTLISSMYLHGDILHLVGNLLYLWVFGDNIENIVGPFRFLIFYTLCGLGATGTHIYIDPHSTIPMIGASGAISGILGAYVFNFPRARVHVLIPIFIFLHVIRIPAVFVLGLWFVLQLINGLAILSAPSQGGIAWFAHIGGFVVGLILINFFKNPRRMDRYAYHHHFYDR